MACEWGPKHSPAAISTGGSSVPDKEGHSVSVLPKKTFKIALMGRPGALFCDRNPGEILFAQKPYRPGSLWGTRLSHRRAIAEPTRLDGSKSGVARSWVLAGEMGMGHGRMRVSAAYVSSPQLRGCSS